MWEYVGAKDPLPGGRARGIVVLVLEEASVHQELIVLYMEPDQHGWSPGKRGRRWTIGEGYDWRRLT